LDGDDPSNQALKAEYGVNSYPRVVFVDSSSGAVINQLRGGMSKNDFETLIKRMLGQI